MVDGVALRPAEHIQAAKFFKRLELLFDGGDDAVVRPSSLIVPSWPCADVPLSPQM